jgi:streptogramin lyase
VIEPPTETVTAVGSDFVGYRIEELIGRGGMGFVYRAFDQRLKRPVALKLVAPSLGRDERFLQRFGRESELVMSLEHPNVIPIYDAGAVDGRVYLAMRLVDGSDLRSVLRREGALAPPRALAICAQIASALDAAHARGLVHRDVKPSNVLLDQTEHVYLADFGLTRRLEDLPGEPGDDRSIGTPAYLAPEQLEGKPVDGRADLYSLGCLLYEALTGEAVFPRSSRLAVAWAHLEEEPPRASRRRPELPEAIDAVIARAMAKEPGQRHSSCAALIAAAEDALGFRKAPLFGRRKPLLVAAAIVVALLVASAAIAAVLLTGAPRTTGTKLPPRLFARANTLARIDPATDKVVAVYRVAADPVVTAAGDYTVWVYSRGGGTVTQIDTVTNRVVETTPVPLPAECCSLFTGPVLAADGSGAWFVAGEIGRRRPILVHIPVGRQGKREYPLRVTPTGVAVGGGAAWVVGHDRRTNEVLRIDQAGDSTKVVVRFPSSARIDSIAYGYGAVWVVSSTTATLYRIEPGPARVQRLVVAHSHATRPEILPRGGDIWVRVTGGGGTTYRIQPSPLGIFYSENDGPPGWEENIGDLGSLWWYDWPTGAVYREEVANGPTLQIRVVQKPPTAGGPCLTSMTTGSGSVWVAVAPPRGFACRR